MRSLKKILFTFIVTCLSFVSYAQNKPNIIYILADDMGIGDISGLNPDSKIKTPNIDKLLDNGMNFTDAHTASSVCTPTRYGIITGRYAWRTKLKKGVVDGYSKTILQDNIDTAPALLQRNGYNTAMIGKWHLGWNWVINNEDSIPRDAKLPEYKFTKEVEKHIDFTKPFSKGPINRGFDYFYGINASLDFPPYVFSENNKVTEIPLENFKRKGPDKSNPDWKKDFDKKQKMQRSGVISSNFDASETLLKLTEHSIDYILKQDNKKPYFLYVALTAPHTPVLPRNEFLGKSKAGAYGDFIQELDWSVGQIIRALEKKGIEENTIIIFTADNGASKISFPLEYEDKYAHKPSRELKGRKGSLYEGGHRVPFIIQWKKIIKPKTINNTSISLNDLYATCASIVGETQKKNQGVDSYSIWDLITGGEGYGRKSSVYSDFGGRFAVRKGNFKLILSPIYKKRKLYNLQDDISENNNLYGQSDYYKIEKDLLNEITKTIKNGRSTNGEKLKNEGTEIWDALYWMK